MSAEKWELGEAIRAARMRRGLTQEALAEMLDITPIHLKNMESARRKPSVPLLFAMMELLDFSVDALDPHGGADGGGAGGSGAAGGRDAEEAAGLTEPWSVPRFYIAPPLDNPPGIGYNREHKEERN